MHYHRVINRNGLRGGQQYDKTALHGDLRRLEHDTLDDQHIAAYARTSGATEDQVRALFKAFFYGCPSTLDQPPIQSATPGFAIAHMAQREESYDA